MSLEQAHRKLLAVDPAKLPPECAALLLAPPVHALPLAPDLTVPSWAPLGGPEATRDLFPKLGIKSWRDSGSSRVIARGMPLQPVIARILATPTWQQRALLPAWTDSGTPLHLPLPPAWTDSGTPLHLYLHPFVDFTDISESRWLAGRGTSRFVSACQRGRSTPQFGPRLRAMQALAAQVADALGDDQQLVELALLPTGEIRLVEVNPALRPEETKALMAG